MSEVLGEPESSARPDKNSVTSRCISARRVDDDVPGEELPEATGRASPCCLSGWGEPEVDGRDDRGAAAGDGGLLACVEDCVPSVLSKIGATRLPLPITSLSPLDAPDSCEVGSARSASCGGAFENRRDDRHRFRSDCDCPGSTLYGVLLRLYYVLQHLYMMPIAIAGFIDEFRRTASVL